jgi:hypothetical protein
MYRQFSLPTNKKEKKDDTKPPTVRMTFLSEQFYKRAKTSVVTIGLGEHETNQENVETMDIGVETMQVRPYNGESYLESGVSAIQLDPRIRFRLLQGGFFVDEFKKNNFKTCMESYISRMYARSEGRNETELFVVVTTNPIYRIAGLSPDEQGTAIAANPLLHLDYFSDELAYSQQVARDPEWHRQNNVEMDNQFYPDKKNLIDVVNVWIPLTSVRDYALGFLPSDYYEDADLVKVRLFGGSVAASVDSKHIRPGAKIHFAPDIKPGDAYFFRSAGVNGKRGVLHAAFHPPGATPSLRRSVEYRALIFERKGKNIQARDDDKVQNANDAAKNLHDLFQSEVVQLSDIQRAFATFPTDSNHANYLKGRTREVLEALAKSWPREWQQPVDGTALKQDVREINAPANPVYGLPVDMKDFLKGSDYLPHIVHVDDSSFIHNCREETEVSRLTLGDLQNVTNKFGVIELFNGFVDDLASFQPGKPMSFNGVKFHSQTGVPVDYFQIREQVSVTRPDYLWPESNIADVISPLRTSIQADVAAMFEGLKAAPFFHPLPNEKEYYFTVELFGGGIPSNFHFWHQDRSILLSRNADIESKDRERIPFSYTGFLYYSGIPSWFLAGGRAVNAIQYFEPKDTFRALGVWFQSTPFHSVPVPDEVDAVNGKSKRFFLRFRIDEVSKDIQVPDRKLASFMNDRFQRWKLGLTPAGFLITPEERHLRRGHLRTLRSILEERNALRGHASL